MKNVFYLFLTFLATKSSATTAIEGGDTRISLTKTSRKLRITCIALHSNDNHHFIVIHHNNKTQQNNIINTTIKKIIEIIIIITHNKIAKKKKKK